MLAITFAFRDRGYDEGEREQLAQLFSRLGSVQLEPHRMPEAGGAAEIWAILEFAAEATAGGVLGSAAYDVLKTFFQLFARWRKDRIGRTVEPEIAEISIKLPDLHLVVGDELYDLSPDVYFMSSEAISLLPEVVKTVMSQLPPETRVEHAIRYVRVAVVTHRVDTAHILSRYWELGLSSDGPTHLFDSWQNTMTPYPTARLVRLRDTNP